MKTFQDPHLFLDKTLLVDRFLQYVQIDTTSNDSHDQCPSTACQFDLAKLLVQHLRELGLSDAQVDENCYVTASLPGQGKEVVGLIAHLDTSPAVSGKNVKPILHQNYQGQAIQLQNDIVIDPQTDDYLSQCLGHTIITADGTTLLGADDKAGIAVILSVLEYYKQNPTTPHPTLKIGFTPDEEIGRGHAKFPLEQFGADVAFTIDGSFSGELNIETFQAYSVNVTIEGVSVHPGMAKGKLVNALRYMGLFLENLPKKISPECTEDREGFIHPYDISGNASKCTCHCLVRDFEDQKAQELIQIIKKHAEDIKSKEPRLKVNVETKFSYPNMVQFIQQKPEIAERLQQAVKMSGLTPRLKPVRGGTDGSSLSQKGLPTPNIFAGGVNFHGPTEWVSTTVMGQAVCTVMNLMTLYAE